MEESASPAQEQWPNDLRDVKSNLNTSQLWVIKEQMELQNFTKTDLQYVMNDADYVMHLNDSEYDVNEYMGLIQKEYLRD